VNRQGIQPRRIFLFKQEYTDAFELRRALGREFRRSLLNVLDANEDGLRTACVVVRSGHHASGLVVVERERRDSESIRHLARIRELPELRSLPLVVLGDDAADALASLRAHEDGADGFIALPAKGADLARVGRAVGEFWGNLELVRSA